MDREKISLPLLGAAVIILTLLFVAYGCSEGQVSQPAQPAQEEQVQFEKVVDVVEPEPEPVVEEEPVIVEEVYYEEPVYYSEPESVISYYEPQSVDSHDDGITAQEFQWLGVVNDDRHTYTWYSENVLPGGGLADLNANGRHSEDGFVKDGDGYIAVASCDYEKGAVIDTPFGKAKVYDTGYLAPGQVDVYTSF